MNASRISDDLRPYFDYEIPQAVKRMLANPIMNQMITFGFGADCVADIRTALMGVRSADDFQHVFVKPMLENIIARTSSGFTTDGLQYISPLCGHLFISNHRDIVLDGALLQLLLLCAGMPTSEITFGSNLISSPFVEDFGRSNKMYKILREGSGRDLVRNSMLLSQHIHNVVDAGGSIWISQRDGRTKNGHDKTDQGLIKMLTLDGRKNPLQAISKLNIIPFAVSYEYESCDALKAREIYMRRRGAYVKAPGEDMRSILQGSCLKKYRRPYWRFIFLMATRSFFISIKTAKSAWHMAHTATFKTKAFIRSPALWATRTAINAASPRS